MGDWNRQINTRKPRWSRLTNNTVMISARITLDQADKLRAYVERSGVIITDVVRRALEEYLNTHEEEEKGQ